MALEIWQQPGHILIDFQKIFTAENGTTFPQRSRIAIFSSHRKYAAAVTCTNETSKTDTNCIVNTITSVVNEKNKSQIDARMSTLCTYLQPAQADIYRH